MSTQQLRRGPVPHRRTASVLLLSSLFVLPSCSEESKPGGTAGSGSGGTAGNAGSAGAGGGNAAGSAGSAGAGGNDAGGNGAALLHLPWAWTGIIGTGQSLSVGEPDGVRGMAA